ncbi:hypothetical protein AM1_B0130 (plasmid) [Acaryochloris marina MBIC11017]|uniref:Uncharacterized protein n=1 Tax=Acaryochloris marina (strain MBIC 11017) TaxID=329726 RepID=A8ZM87_ACAM1|nr:hypothetical protein AM1_B0130 [Acaryochloris marina MBIC11017]
MSLACREYAWVPLKSPPVISKYVVVPLLWGPKSSLTPIFLAEARTIRHNDVTDNYDSLSPDPTI